MKRASKIPVRLDITRLNKQDLAWAAGFYDGEGNTRPTLRKAKSKYQTPKVLVQATTSQVELDPIQKFVDAVQVGKLYGPYVRKGPNQRPIYRYCANSFESVQQLACLLWPYLCSPKKSQFRVTLIEYLKIYREYPRQPGGQKARKHCRRGKHDLSEHAYITPTGRRYCKPCSEDYRTNRVGKMNQKGLEQDYASS